MGGDIPNFGLFNQQADVEMILQKLFLPALAGLAILVSACSEEISVVKPGASVPVIYAVFDIRDSAHHVKLSKTFAGTGDVLELVTEKNQLFYEDAEVFLTDLAGRGHTNFDLVADISRDSGFFPTLPNQAYRFTGQLRSGSYRLMTVLPADGDTLCADFHILDNFKVLSPRAGIKRFYFYDDPAVFSWDLNPEAGLFELSFTFHYLEMMKTGESSVRFVRFSRQIKPDILEVDKDHYNYRFYSEPFFAFIGTRIRPQTLVDYRKPLRLDMEITAADTTLSRYLNWFGMEIDEKINPNGNITGAIGVVASKYTVTFPDLIFSPRAQDSLVRGRFTGELGFVANSEWQ